MKSVFSVPLLFALLAAQAQSPSVVMHKVWEIDLRKAIDAKGQNHSLPIFALRFSPDGKRLAAIAGFHGEGDQLRNYLLILDADHPGTPLQQFEVKLGANEDEHGPATLEFGWSPSGQIVYATGSVIRVETGKVCTLPSATVVINDDLAISRDFSVRPGSHFTFYNSQCQAKGTWDVAEDWMIHDVSLDRGLLAVTSVTGSAPFETWIVDALERKVTRRFRGIDVFSARFADKGKAVCSGSASDERRAPATCWDVDTGKKIGESPKSNVRMPGIAAAAKASRVIISDYRRKAATFDHEYDSVFEKRVVWDFGTGKEFAAWRPERQPYTFSPKEGVVLKMEDIFRSAISPDGECVAEGGNGVVRLYKIEP